MQGLVVYAFLPAVLYCIPHDSEVVQYMTTKKGNNEFKIGYDRSQPNPEELGDFSKETSFREKLPSDEDYIAIINDATGCWSTIGRQEGMQEVNLEAPLCVQLVGTVTHELMHAAGFLHELTRPDRDDFVEINWSNVREAYKHNFKKQRVGEVDYYGVTYDYNSVMHYSKFAFTKDRSIPSVIAKVPDKAKNMGQRQGFSIKDIAEVNAMYNCSEKTKVALNEYNEKKPGVPVEDYIFSE
nr:unnamed protein product [Callosobruchus chinensis]